MTDKEIFDAFMREMRIKGWTVDQIAEEMNICPATFYNWQNGKISRRGRRAIIAYLSASKNGINIQQHDNSGPVIGVQQTGTPEDFSAAIRKVLASPELTPEEKNKVVKVLIG